MKRDHRINLVGRVCIATAALMIATAGIAEAKKCSADSVAVGPACVDKYEASVWETTDAPTIKLIQKGKIDAVADLAAATARGVVGGDYGAGCPVTGNGCMDSYAVSLAGVSPSAYITWFQAAAACRNSGKRLATNQEWQMAALGTPDPGTDNGTTDCNVSLAAATTNAGSRSGCVSDAGAFDTVGNLLEWVADWGDRATSACTVWGAGYGDDFSCIGGDGTVNLPGGLLRGGDWDVTFGGTGAGVFAVGVDYPSSAFALVGFRCAR